MRSLAMIWNLGVRNVDQFLSSLGYDISLAESNSTSEMINRMTEIE